jgi:hypothetical protein
MPFSPWRSLIPMPLPIWCVGKYPLGVTSLFPALQKWFLVSFCFLLECTAMHLRVQSEMTHSSPLLTAIIRWTLRISCHIWDIDVWCLHALLASLEHS